MTDTPTPAPAAERVELLPCPFCGSVEVESDGWASAERAGPGCDSCGATASTVSEWNTRPREEAFIARAEKAEAALKQAGWKLSSNNECWMPDINSERAVMQRKRMLRLFEVECRANKAEAELAEMRVAAHKIRSRSRWVSTNKPPLVGGCVLIGGYVTKTALGRHFDIAIGSVFSTVNGPIWSCTNPNIPMQYWLEIGPHPEYLTTSLTTSASIDTADAQSGESTDGGQPC